jgi:hypothetical protein
MRTGRLCIGTDYAYREAVAGIVSLVIGRSHTDNCRVRAPGSAPCSLADLAMAQAPLDAIMTRDVAETLVSPAVSGGAGEPRAAQWALGMR